VRRYLVLLCCGWLLACVGTETGNPSFDGSLGYDAYSSADSVALLASALSQDIQVDVGSTWLVLGSVDFVPRIGDTCAATDVTSGASQRAPALGAGDHVKSQAPPTQFALGSGYYCSATLPLVNTNEPPASAPTGLKGHSILLQGELSDGRSFELRSSTTVTLALQSQTAQGFELDADQSGVLIGFDLAAWLNDLPWKEAVVGTDDNQILADATHNTDLLGAFEQRLPAGVGLFRDADRDGLLDKDPVALAHGRD
jgi:hypothetical protein